MASAKASSATPSTTGRTLGTDDQHRSAFSRPDLPVKIGGSPKRWACGRVRLQRFEDGSSLFETPSASTLGPRIELVGGQRVFGIVRSSAYPDATLAFYRAVIGGVGTSLRGRQRLGGSTRPVAAVPDECAGQFGPQLAALIAYLTVVCTLAAPGRRQRCSQTSCRFRSAWEVRSTRGKRRVPLWRRRIRSCDRRWRTSRFSTLTKPAIGRTGRNAGSGHSSPQPLCSIPSPPRVEPTSCGTCSARPLPASWAATDCRRT